MGSGGPDCQLIPLICGELSSRDICSAARVLAEVWTILSLVQSLAVEWAPKVRVTAVSPGLVKTENSHLHYGDDEGIAAVSATIPAGRMAEPEDIANACLFLASPQASYASGSNLLLNGGGEMPAFLNAGDDK